jgi:hypothetical protein
MINVENIIKETHPDILKINDCTKSVREFLKKLNFDKKIIKLAIKNVKNNLVVPTFPEFKIYSHRELCLLAKQYCENLMLRKDE